MMSSRHTTQYPNTKGIISHRPPAMFKNYIHFSPTSFIHTLQNINAMRQIYAFSPSLLFRLHPPTLPRPLRRPTRLPLHLLMREPPPIRTRLRIITLSMPLLAAKPKFLVLLLALEVSARTTATIGFLVGAVELDVEEVFFVGRGRVGAGTLCRVLVYTCEGEERKKDGDTYSA